MFSGESLVDGMSEFVEAFTRKHSDKIGIDIERISSRLCVRSVNIFDGMSATNRVKRGLIKRLRIYRNTRYTRFVHNFQLNIRNSIGSSRLDCELALTEIAKR